MDAAASIIRCWRAVGVSMVEACAGFVLAEDLKALRQVCALRTVHPAPRARLMLEASFPKPLLDGKRKPETANHPGLQSVVAADADGAVVAVVVAKWPWCNLPFPALLSSANGRTVTDEVGQQPI